MLQLACVVVWAQGNSETASQSALGCCYGTVSRAAR